MQIHYPWTNSLYTRVIIINISTFILGCYFSLNSGSPSSHTHQEILTTSPGSKLIISFSLYGNNTLYTIGALRNAQVIPLLYRGWVARFYIDESVPQSIVDELHRLGSEVIPIDYQESWMDNGRLWRYLALDDPQVKIVMFRDADSRITTRELEAVNTWFQSGYEHHIMRDHPNHNRLIMSGLWSATTLPIRSNLSLRQALINMKSKHPTLDDSSAEDIFLSTLIWPLIKTNVLIHDAFNCESVEYGELSHPFPAPREWHADYVGRSVVESFDENSDYYRNGQMTLNGGITPIECRLTSEHLEG